MKRLKHHLWWLIPLLIVDAIALIWHLTRQPASDADRRPPASAPAVITQPPASALARMRFPTDQDRLLDPNAVGVFQPTAAGTPESGRYGSVRTGQVGKQLVPRFHEGLDIAPTGRDRHGRPTDQVYAVADGTVAFINRHAGNSDYGKYVVLTHNDPVGEIYTLYAHLASFDPHIKEGIPVQLGAVLGTMGNTALEAIPMHRAHVHFEIGLIANSHFHLWARKQRQPFTGGIYNGQNLLGVNPLDVFAAQRNDSAFSLLSLIRRTPIAFELVVPCRRMWDFFERYPELWTDDPFRNRPIVVAVSEGGVVLNGRHATEDEQRALGRLKALVQNVNADVLGRNGRRIIVRRNGEWALGSNGERWLEILNYHP